MRKNIEGSGLDTDDTVGLIMVNDLAITLNRQEAVEDPAKRDRDGTQILAEDGPSGLTTEIKGKTAIM